MYPRLNLTAAAGLSELSFTASQYSFYSERCLKGWINPQQGLFRIWEVFKPVHKSPNMAEHKTRVVMSSVCFPWKIYLKYQLEYQKHSSGYLVNVRHDPHSCRYSVLRMSPSNSVSYGFFFLI